MTISLKHAFTSAKGDGGDATLIRPSNWNAEHVLTLAQDKIIGRASTGVGAAEEIACTPAARNMLAGATNAAILAALGLTNPTATANIADQAVTYPKMQAPSAVARILGSNGNAALAITGAANNGSGLIRLSVASSATFATGQNKIVAGVTGTTEANGRWTITVVDATHIDLQGSAFANAYVSGGTIGGGVDELKLGSGLSLLGDTLSALSPLPNYLAGLELSTAGSSSTFGIAVGGAADDTNATLLSLAAAITKTTSAWAVGSGNGALDTGTIAPNTWYHAFLIERTDTGVVDALVSTSPSAPTMPASYNRKRHIGMMRTNGASQWTAFTQLGDMFLWTTSVADYTNGAVNSAARTTKALTVPTGKVVTGLFRASIIATSGSVRFSALSDTDVVVTINNCDITATGSASGSGRFAVMTDTLGQIGHRENVTGPNGLSIDTYGWIYTRGR